jgi:hypothetical protein
MCPPPHIFYKKKFVLRSISLKILFQAILGLDIGVADQLICEATVACPPSWEAERFTATREDMSNSYV